MPTAKLTTDKLTTLITAVVVAVALHVFDVELGADTILAISGAVGWAIGGIAGYFKAETSPAPSSFAYLPPEVAPPQ